MTFKLTSQSFRDGDYLDQKHILSKEFGFGCAGGNQSPQPGTNDRVVIDNQDSHASAVVAVAEITTGSAAITAKPSPSFVEKVKRPPIALTRSFIPTRP